MHLLSEFAIINNYTPQNTASEVGRAYYQTSQDRFIYTNCAAAKEFLATAKLAFMTDIHAWFYQDAALWQVEIATGSVTKQYTTLQFSGVATAITRSNAWQSGTERYFSVTQQRAGAGKEIQSVYQVTDESLQLLAIEGDEALVAQLEACKGTINSENVASWRWAVNEAVAHLGGVLIAGSTAASVHITRQSDGSGQHYWLKKNGDNFTGIKANLATSPADLTLAAITQHNTGYYFFSKQLSKIYFQADAGWTNLPARDVAIGNVAGVFTQEQRYFAQTTANTFWLLDNQGQGQLAGFMQDLLKINNNNDSLNRALKSLATANTTNTLVLLGMRDAIGKTLNAWYDITADKIIVGSANLSNEISYLGLNPEKTHAWLFDSTAKTLYRQTLLAGHITFNDQGVPSTLAEAALPYTGLAGQPITQVIRHGNALQLTTEAGAILQLATRATLKTAPALIAWHCRNSADLTGLAAQIKALPAEVACVATIRLFGLPNQTPAWYLVAADKVIQSPGINNQHLLSYFGKAANQNAEYCYDQDTHQLYLVTANQAALAGNYHFINLEPIPKGINV